MLTVEGSVLYRNIFREMKKQNRNYNVFPKNYTECVASPTSPSNSATPETAWPTPHPPSPQPTQREDRGEDHYDDPLPLNE